MSAEDELWDRYCRCLYRNAEMGFALDCSRMRTSDDFLERMQPSMRQALAAMRALEAGAVANADEGRMVGHYWLRNPGLAPTPEIAERIRAVLENVHQFAERVHSGQVRGEGGLFENVLVVGIGGSALGPQLLHSAFTSPADKLRLHFFDNTDPDGFDRVLERLRSGLGRTLVIVISKSGGTAETRNGMLELRSVYQHYGLSFAAHAAVITEGGSRLDQMAQEEGWLGRFSIWDWVGGRTSLTSAVGALPALLQGIDFRSFLAGATEMDSATRLDDIRRNPAALLALHWHHAGNGRGDKIMVVLPYKDRLELFAKYLQQLVMESIGKERDRSGNTVHQGLTVLGNKGSTDQHSYVQQLRDGRSDFFATFVEVLKDRSQPALEVEPHVTSGDYLNAFLHGTRQALHESGRESITITIDEVTPRSVGRLVALYERAVGLYAELVNLNAYHQPGVQAGKTAAAELLDIQRQATAWLHSNRGQYTAEEIARGIGRPAEPVFHILQHLAANAGQGIGRIDSDDPRHIRFASA